MGLDDRYIADSISVRDQEGQKLVYQRNRDHMYLISEFGVKIIYAFAGGNTVRAALAECGIQWDGLSVALQDRICSFIDGLRDRQLLLELSVTDSREEKGGD